MRKIVSVLLCVLLICLLPGCTKDRMQAKENTVESTAPSIPETTAPTKMETMDAEELYWKARNVNGSSRATQYTREEVINVRAGSQGVYIRTDIHSIDHVLMSSSPFAINVETTMFYKVMELEIEDILHRYHRKENGKTVTYYYLKNADTWALEESDILPSAISSAYAVYCFQGGTTPEGLVLEPETQMVEDREAYVLSWPTSGDMWFAYFGNEEQDKLIREMTVPVRYFIDVESLALLKVEVNLDEQGEVLGEILHDTVASMISGETDGVTVEINSYVITFTELSSDPVEVPAVPEEGAQRAKQAAGYTFT